MNPIKHHSRKFYKNFSNGLFGADEGIEKFFSEKGRSRKYFGSLFRKI